MRRSARRRFAHQLALKVGCVNVDAMLRSITVKQWWDWEAYAQFEPFDETRADVRAAQIAQMIFNMAVGKKDRKKLSEFVLKFGEQVETQKRQTPKQQLEILRLLSIMHNIAPNAPES